MLGHLELNYEHYNNCLYTLCLSEIHLDLMISKLKIVRNKKCLDDKHFVEELEKYDSMEKLLIHCSNLCLTDNAIYHYAEIELILNIFILETQTQNYNLCTINLKNIININKIKQTNYRYNVILTLTNKMFVDKIVYETYNKCCKMYYLYDDLDHFKKYLFDTYDKLITLFHNNDYKTLFEIIQIVNIYYSPNTKNVFSLFLPGHFTIISKLFNCLIHNILGILFKYAICSTQYTNFYNIIVSNKKFHSIEMENALMELNNRFYKHCNNGNTTKWTGHLEVYCDYILHSVPEYLYYHFYVFKDVLEY